MDTMLDTVGWFRGASHWSRFTFDYRLELPGMMSVLVRTKTTTFPAGSEIDFDQLAPY